MVLCRAVTGLATVRALARQGVVVHAFVLDRSDPLRGSRHGRHIDVADLARDEAGLVDRIIRYARGLGHRPVLIPTSDATALMVSAYRTQLQAVCRVWTTDTEALQQIVTKEQLYARAAEAGVSTIPFVANATASEVADWSSRHPGPYFLKPSYEAIGQSSVRGKNHILHTREELLAFVGNRGLRHAVVQRCLQGGDGEIFDSYGLCDRAGRVRVMASHRRLRQYPPHTGVTCFGAIPSGLVDDEVLFGPTERLMRAWRYHGIFGIEWLRDRSTGEFHVIDFNARPFSSIGHLCDGGLNLPWLAWRELQDDALDDIVQRPPLPSTTWVDSLRDLASWRRARRGSIFQWVNEWRRADLHAYWSAEDPGPVGHQALEVARVMTGVAWRRLRAGLAGAAPVQGPARRLEDRHPPIVRPE